MKTEPKTMTLIDGNQERQISIREINFLIRSNGSLYTYYKEPDGIPLRIIFARTKKKIQEVFVLTSGKWKTVKENGVLYQQ